MKTNAYKIKKFTYEEFLNMTDWTQKSSVVKKNENLLVTTKTGFKFYVGSTDEKYIFDRLNKQDDVIDIRGQNFVINYRYSGKEREYHPDFVVFYKNGTICLYEVKPVIQMAMHEVLVKYDRMKKFASRNGYLYEMIGKTKSNKKFQIKSFSEIKKRTPNQNFKQFVENIIDTNKYFLKTDMVEYKRNHNFTENQLEYDLISIVLNGLDTHYMFSSKGESIYSWKIRRPRFKNKIKLD